MGKGASLGEETILAGSGREGEVVPGVVRVRNAAGSVSCSPRYLSLIGNLGTLSQLQQCSVHV